MKTSIILASIIVIILSSNIAFGQVTASGWYPGKGLQEGLLVKYKVSGFELTKDKDVILTMWFKNKTMSNNWNVYMILEDSGRVIDGWEELSSVNLAPQGISSDKEFEAVKKIFKNSINWVGGYASSEEPKSLSIGSTWGSIASIGGGGITLRISEENTKVNAAGEEWSVSVLKWAHKIDLPSEVWITNSFPLPIWGLSYAQSSQEPIPIQFKFELLMHTITNEQPIPPEEQIELPTPPLQQLTRSGGFLIELHWKPDVIESQQPIKMAPVIKNAQGQPLVSAIYNIVIRDKNNNEVFREDNIRAENGIGKTHEITFNDKGNYKVSIECTTCQFGNIAPTPEATKFVEVAEFNIVVVPEFPISAIVAIASMITVLIIMIRFKPSILKI
jgi:hypothetical protein